MAPSEESTRSIEEVIRARCKDGLWDDVVRRAALKPTDFRPKPADLSLEKSDKGLGDEYAAAFETNARTSEEMPRTPLSSVLGSKGADAVAKAHEEARALLAKLDSRLDPLFSFHYAPPPAKREAPAVSLEEKVPTALAASSTLAPEEVYGRKRSDKALADRAELSQGERKALRSKKKRAFFSSMQAASQAPGGLAGSKRQRVADARKAAQGAGAADGASFKL
ncbi:hypothetical protein EMIHUDRAFT_252467 [Emiliania huxleyi CCMP1516]|uniref:Ribosome biogenesis regulatory protein n=2 Tax=Emiliania huxleyi TaxID=2903 RepID=A0A0D3KJQ8_EMIH1|nr:hypothetical protein EMIHUDRAFT_252467 [Emiliania huxleyi CCMP1516]EOD35993.1 hypothetical protein EMIHUDRAFT_252467 [Emiliania huxleyi CCMP1516]|eukprot:XP_005788422.1 hypothetical protein EMIHUDRAFT_252467 [Emiliania huxleyi CCMP1516]